MNISIISIKIGTYDGMTFQEVKNSTQVSERGRFRKGIETRCSLCQPRAQTKFIIIILDRYKDR